MKRPWRAIAWGMLILLLDLRIGGFDVIPDALGYLLAARGLAGLPPNRGPKLIAVWGLIASALLTLWRFIGGYAGSLAFEPPVLDTGYFLSMAADAAHVVMAYGLIELRAAAFGGDRNAEKAGVFRLWSWYLTVHALFLIVSPFLAGQFAGDYAWMIVLAFVPALLVTEIALIRLLFRRVPDGRPA